MKEEESTKTWMFEPAYQLAFPGEVRKEKDECRGERKRDAERKTGGV